MTQIERFINLTNEIAEITTKKELITLENEIAMALAHDGLTTQQAETLERLTEMAAYYMEPHMIY